MISRLTTKIIADAYHSVFSSMETVGAGYARRTEFKLRINALYDFLYIHDFDAWILNIVKEIGIHDRRGLIEFVMRLHTGETLTIATKTWDQRSRGKLGQRILRDLAEALIATERSTDGEQYDDADRRHIDKMVKTLELDGYVYKNNTLLIPEAGVLDEQEEAGVLAQLFKDTGLDDHEMLDHNLRLSEEHYRNERWEDSISNSRKVLELVLMKSAKELSKRRREPISEHDLERPVEVRNYLEQHGLVERREKDAIAAIYGLLSHTGGHPYLAQRDQARLMRHYSLTTSQFALLRLSGAIREKPH